MWRWRGTIEFVIRNDFAARVDMELDMPFFVCHNYTWTSPSRMEASKMFFMEEREKN